MDDIKVQLENEKVKIFEEVQKLQTKLEEEIKMRLFFENKLNSLHHINMEHHSKNKLLTAKFEKLEVEYSHLRKEYDV